MLIGLAAVAIMGVGFIGAVATRDLGRSAERSVDINLVVRELDATLISRTGIDTDILQAAAEQRQSAGSYEITRQPGWRGRRRDDRRHARTSRISVGAPGSCPSRRDGRRTDP